MLRFEFEGYNNLKDFCIQFVLDLGGAVEAAKALKAASKKAPAEEEEPPVKKKKPAVEEEEPQVKKKKPAAEEEEEEEGPTFDDVRDALKKLMGTDKEDQIPVILSDYGVERISELKKPQFAKVLKDFNKAIKASSPVSA